MFLENNTETNRVSNYLDNILNLTSPITPEILFEAFTKCKINEQDKLQLLLEKAFTQGISIDVQQSKGMNFTLLHYAIYYGFSSVVEFLLNEGVNPNIQDIIGDTPLHELVEAYTQPNNTSINTIELLIKKSDIELKNSVGYTPLQLTVKNNFIDSWHLTEIVKLLVQYGADMSDANINESVHINHVMMSQAPLIQLAPQSNTELKALLKLIKACKDNDFSIIGNFITTQSIKEFINWQISITPENSRFFSKHLSELYNLQNYLTFNSNLTSFESMDKLKSTINSYSTLKNSLIFKIIENPELHNKICNENFISYNTISEDLIDKFKSCGLKLADEITETNTETS